MAAPRRLGVFAFALLAVGLTGPLAASAREPRDAGWLQLAGLAPSAALLDPLPCRMAVDGVACTAASTAPPNERSGGMWRRGLLPVVGASCDEPPGEIAGNVTLPVGCTYNLSHGLKIVTNNTTLDCWGSTFLGNGQVGIGLLIDSRGRPMSNIVVRNCIFRDFRFSGVRVTWSAHDNEKGSEQAEIYRRTPTNILLDRLEVTDSGRVGIYIDDYVTYLTLSNSRVSGSGGVAVYLEHSSRFNRIVNNEFSDNGHRGGREAVAVDSSADNLIENNLFRHNRKGSVFLYKNCGEHVGSPNSYNVVRWQHSDRNRIVNNHFFDEPVGVWLASRQSRDLAHWDCTDEPMEPTGHFFLDFADDNEVASNVFCRTPVAIRDEGDNNRIIGNRFEAQLEAAIQLPVTARQRFLGRPQAGTLLQDNQTAHCEP
jgi:hypothetical protein